MRKRSIVAAAIFTFAACSSWFINKYFGLEAHAIVARLWLPPTLQQVETRQLRQIAGWFALDCGHIRHREDADSAIACAESALRERRRFYVAFDFVGVDARGTIALASNSAGALYEVTTDELGHGAFGYVQTAGTVRKTTIVRCGRPPVEQTSYPANRYLSCLTAVNTE